MELQPLLSACDIDDLDRIDVGLEGSWSQSVCTVWTRGGGWIGTQAAVKEHAIFKPSVELYFSNGWIGLHCFRRQGDSNVLDEPHLEQIVSRVEAALRDSTRQG